MVSWDIIVDNSVYHEAKCFPDDSNGKESTCKAGDLSSTLGWEDPLEKRMTTPFQYYCLENSIDRGAWWTIVHVVAESDTTKQLTHTLTHTVNKNEPGLNAGGCLCMLLCTEYSGTFCLRETSKCILGWSEWKILGKLKWRKSTSGFRDKKVEQASDLASYLCLLVSAPIVISNPGNSIDKIESAA